MTTDWSKTGVWLSDLRTTPLVPNGVAPWDLFLMAPVLGLGSVVGCRAGVAAGLEGPGVVSMGTGASTWGSLNSNRGGVRREDSPGTSEAVCSISPWSAMGTLPSAPISGVKTGPYK